MKELLIIAIGSAFVNNVVLSQFLGIEESRDSKWYGGRGYFRYYDRIIFYKLDL